MKYAFDWGGTLNVNPALMAIAKSLFAVGHEIYILSVAWPHEDRFVNPDKWMFRNGLDFFTGIHIIKETGFTQHGEEKVKLMKELGCSVIFDDNQDVIDKARAAGFLALKVPYKDH